MEKKAKTQSKKDMESIVGAMKESLKRYRKAGIEPTLAQWIKDAEKTYK